MPLFLVDFVFFVLFSCLTHVPKRLRSEKERQDSWSWTVQNFAKQGENAVHRAIIVYYVDSLLCLWLLLPLLLPLLL